jgi:hypothetical protein
MSSIFWTMVMSMNLLLVLFTRRSARDLEALEKYYFFLCFGFPFAMAFVPILFSSGPNPVYGPEMLRCWISNQWPVLRLSLFYAPIWVIFLFNLSVYITAGSFILDKSRYAGGSDSPVSSTAPVETKERSRTGSSLFIRFPRRSSSFLSDHSSVRSPGGQYADNFSMDSSFAPSWSRPIRSFRTR